MKASFSILDSTAEALRRAAERLSGGNASVVVDAALRDFFRTPGNEQAAAIARVNAEKTAAGDRNAWMRAFWQWLAGLYEFQDVNDNPYAPRTYNDCLIVFLLKSQNEYPGETEAFRAHVSPTGNADASRRRDFAFDRNSSAIDAAESIYKWLHEGAAR